ncbi:MAG: hypothetical protein JSV88_27005 [Candidatus Aminicenantes bacterium]|nr:MAG: hypothetical protein JSV88_27005 [Candidatus Aminicenantes bacterium]
MNMQNKQDGSARLLRLALDDLFAEASKAVDERDFEKFKDIEVLVIRFYCKKIARHQLEELGKFNKLMVNFLASFEWGGKPKWKKAVPIVDKFKTILELSQLISETESPQKAYKELKKKSYGMALVSLLYQKKMMRPGEIRKALHIRSIQQVSNLLSDFEKFGIIVREGDGKNVWISLGMQGLSVYKEHIEPAHSQIGQLTIDVLKAYDEKDFEKAKGKLKEALKKDPQNPFLICLLGLIALEKEDLKEAGELLAKAVRLGFGVDERETFLLFYILEKEKRLESLKKGIFAVNWQNDKISAEIKASLQILVLLCMYRGDTDRARDYQRLMYS